MKVILQIFYLSKDEYSKFYSTMLNSNFDTIKGLESIDYEKIAYKRWLNDKERLELIKKLGLEE